MGVSFLTTLLGRGFNVRREERRAVAWALLYVGALFLAYYMLRPIRDEMGVAGGVRNLPWLFTGTLCAMLVASPLFAWTVRRWTRERFIAVTYRFFAANLLGFVALLEWGAEEWIVWVGRAFFIWVSVFNLFVVSVFWSLVVDVFRAEQGRRLFGLLAAGVTAGGLIGSAGVSVLAPYLERRGFLLLAVLLIEVAVWAAKGLSSFRGNGGRGETVPKGAAPLGGGVFAGAVHTFRNPYLGGIAAFVLCYSVLSTFLYFQQAAIVEGVFADRAARVVFFARVDMWVNGLTLVLQLAVTGRVLGRVGVVATLCVLPVVSLGGFSVLAVSPTVAVLVGVQVARRVANFAFARPARELLFTAVSREDRYKAKNFIDTAVYRSGDQIGSWGYAGLMAAGLGLAQVPFVALPLCVGWIVLAVWLGKRLGEVREESVDV